MLRNHDPLTALEAKFSMEFAMASALVARRVSPKELDDAFVCRADVKAATKKSENDDNHRADDGYAIRPHRVNVAPKSGEILEHEPLTRPKGSWQTPLKDAELRDKFMDCAGKGLPKAHAARLLERLEGLVSLASLRELPIFNPVR